MGFCICLLLISSILIGQTPFTLNDTSLVVGQEYEYPIHISNVTARLKGFRSHDTSSFDSLVRFLKVHQDKKFEIGVHTDYRGKNEFNKKVSKAQAEYLIAILLEHGIDESQLIPVGYGEMYLRYNEFVINGFKTEEERKKAHLLNGRIVFIVREIDHLYNKVK